MLEEFSAVVSKVAIESNVTFINLRLQILKYLEAFNDNNLHHSILTYDGFNLNRAGNILLAAIFLQEMGFDNCNLLNNPILDLHIQRKKYQTKKNELDPNILEKSNIEARDL